MSKKKEKPGEIQGVFIQMKARTMCICDKHVEKENDAVILYDKAQVMHMECYTAMVVRCIQHDIEENGTKVITTDMMMSGFSNDVRISVEKLAQDWEKEGGAKSESSADSGKKSGDSGAKSGDDSGDDEELTEKELLDILHSENGQSAEA
jgi:hypothetical protein